jgi:parallel beta-helix repeat protein
MNKTVFFLFTILCTLFVVFLGLLSTRSVEAWNGTVYIRADGYIDPSDAPIQRYGDIYTLAGDITSDADGLIIERNNMTLNGEGHTIQGQGEGNGISIFGLTNVTITNVKIEMHSSGIRLSDSSYINISKSTIANNSIAGISVAGSSNNCILANNITENGYAGIVLTMSWNGTVFKNHIAGNRVGIYIGWSGPNLICGNFITRNNDGMTLESTWPFMVTGNNITENSGFGVTLSLGSSGYVYNNNFIHNLYDVSISGSKAHPTIAFWDSGYPSGGNYWSDYTGMDLFSGPFQNETGSDGIGDTPYIIDENNRDNCPLMIPWGSLLGDANGDGYVGIDDIYLVASHFSREAGDPEYNRVYDLNGDGYIGVDDIFTVAKHFGQEENP